MERPHGLQPMFVDGQGAWVVGSGWVLVEAGGKIAWASDCRCGVVCSPKGPGAAAVVPLVIEAVSGER